MLRAELFEDDRSELIGAYLFGSHAKNAQRPDSDVDLAFLARRSLEPERVFAAAQRIAERLGRDVDLVDLSRASTVFRAQIVGGGRQLDSSSPRALAEFEMYALSDYARLNEERAAAVQTFVQPRTLEDIAPHKVAVVERCLARIREEFRDDPRRLDELTVEDSIVLNLQRACEASIDLAMHLVAASRAGVPQSSRDAFDALERSAGLDSDLAGRMRRMVGLGNIAVHDYQRLSRPIVLSIVRERLGDFEAFCQYAVTR